jgi:hypothetical protein
MLADLSVLLQDSIDSNKNYILAIEVANPDGSWPTHVPGDPFGDFDCYSVLIGRPVYSTAAKSCSSGGSTQQRQKQQYADADGATTVTSSWEHELAEALDTVFGGIATELKETSVGIVNTARYSQIVKMPA